MNINKILREEVELIKLDNPTLENINQVVPFPIHIYSRMKDTKTGFAGQRNFGIEKSSGDWILILDSDETIHPNLYWELLSLIQTENILAWYFPRVLLFPDDKHFLIDAYPDYQMRLFKRVPEIKFTRKVHEYLIGTDKEGKEHSLGIGQAHTKITKKVHFYHFQLLSSKEKLKEKSKRWMELAKDSKQNGFEIIGEDAYQFNTYQHRIAPLSEELKL